jgi:tRNA A58 N-methylase Trm61
MLAFFGIEPGMKVGDLWASGGYTTELLARAVAPSGKVFSQNGEADDAWKALLKEPGMSNLVELQKPFTNPGDILAGTLFHSTPKLLFGALAMPQTWEGVVFGRLYLRRGLEASIIAHASMDVALFALAAIGVLRSHPGSG